MFNKLTHLLITLPIRHSRDNAPILLQMNVQEVNSSNPALENYITTTPETNEKKLPSSVVISMFGPSSTIYTRIYYLLLQKGHHLTWEEGTSD